MKTLQDLLQMHKGVQSDAKIVLRALCFLSRVSSFSLAFDGTVVSGHIKFTKAGMPSRRLLSSKPTMARRNFSKRFGPIHEPFCRKGCRKTSILQQPFLLLKSGFPSESPV
jgi:hypothetical protein